MQFDGCICQDSPGNLAIQEVLCTVMPEELKITSHDEVCEQDSQHTVLAMWIPRENLVCYDGY